MTTRPVYRSLTLGDVLCARCPIYSAYYIDIFGIDRDSWPRSLQDEYDRTIGQCCFRFRETAFLDQCLARKGRKP